MKYRIIYDKGSNRIFLIQRIDKNNEFIVSDNVDEIIKIVNIILPSSYVIYSQEHSYIKLVSEKEEISLTFKNLNEVFSNSKFRELGSQIENIGRKNGYILLDNAKGYKKPKKDSKFKSFLIKRVVPIGMTIALGIAGIVSLSKNGGHGGDGTVATTLTNDFDEETSKGETLESMAPSSSSAVPYTESSLETIAPLSTSAVPYTKASSETIAPSTTVEEVQDNDIPTVNLEFGDTSNTQKAHLAKELYYPLIEKYSHLMGLDPNLVLSMATQERGVHDTIIDKGGAVGLMQIQVSSWLGDNIPYYELNEETGIYEEKVINNVTMEMLQDVETNIKIGCAILQDSLRELNYNIPAAIQGYTMSPGDVKEMMQSYSAESGIPFEEIINNPLELGWMKYRPEHVGHVPYVECVNEWADENVFSCIDVRNGNVVSIRFSNANEIAIHR